MKGGNQILIMSLLLDFPFSLSVFIFRTCDVRVYHEFLLLNKIQTEKMCSQLSFSQNFDALPISLSPYFLSFTAVSPELCCCV